MRKIFIFSSLFLPNILCSQEMINIGFGADAGYKCITYETGFLLELKIKKYVDLYAASTFGKYSGFGYTLGTEIYTMYKKKYQPYIGFSYNNQKGDAFYIGQDGVNRTDLRVNASESWVGSVGVRFYSWFNNSAEIEGNFLTFTPYLSYRYQPSPNKVVYESGFSNENAERKINTRIGEGFGAGLKVIYFFDFSHLGKKNKKKDGYYTY